MDKRQLITITGPVGGGKSSTAIALCDLYRAEGISAAVIDLDDVYLMAHPDFTHDGWDAARRGAGALANQFLADGSELVIVEGGGTYTEEKFCALETFVSRAEKLHRITLLVSHGEVRRNVAADPERDYTVSATPGELYQRYDSALPFLMENTTVVKTNGLSLAEVTKRVYMEVSRE